jgi:hypothetical protein
MNRREKKRLRKNYINIIDNKITEHERSGVWTDNINDTAYYNNLSKMIRLLKELKDIIINIDFKIFHHLHKKYLLPGKYILGSLYRVNDLKKYIDKIKEDELFNREYSLNSLLD